MTEHEHEIRALQRQLEAAQARAQAAEETAAQLRHELDQVRPLYGQAIIERDQARRKLADLEEWRKNLDGTDERLKDRERYARLAYILNNCLPGMVQLRERLADWKPGRYPTLYVECGLRLNAAKDIPHHNYSGMTRGELLKLAGLAMRQGEIPVIVIMRGNNHLTAGVFPVDR